MSSLTRVSYLVSLVVGYDLLFQTNDVRKSMQCKHFDVCKFVEITEVYEFVNEYM